MPTKTLQGKFTALRDGMRKFLIERDDEIDLFILSVLSRSHAFLYGPPGIAKSFLIETGMAHIDDLTDEDYFHILMMKSTTPEQVFGPLSLSKLKEDHYYFIPDGYLPVAKFAFLDEMWKANGAIQNALLWATNERKYRNDGKIYDLPLHSMFIASNEVPDDESLRAIYDRFPLRKIVNPINEGGNYVKMLAANGATPSKVITWGEIVQAADEVKQVKISTKVLEKMVDVKAQLAEKSIFPSDRRMKQSLSIVKAAAWMDSETEADQEHLQVLRFVLWDDPEHFPAVEEVALKCSNPLDSKIVSIMNDLSKLNAELDRAIADPGDQENRQRTGAQIYEKIKLAKEELVGISKEIKGSKKRSVKLSQAAEQVSGITKRMLNKIFDTSEEEIEEGLKDFVSFADEAKEVADGS